MDPVPVRLSKTDVWNAAEAFRHDNIHNEDIPVNIENVMQSVLGIQIIPIENLQSHCNLEGFISLDFKFIYIDKYQYETDSYYKRVRFTIAHEIGHRVLHRDTIASIKLESKDEWIKFRMNLKEDSLGWFEWQASEFAGRLLVPINKLISEFKAVRNEVIKSNTSWNAPAIDSAEMFTLVAPIIAPKFDVSSEVIEIRLNKEGAVNFLR